MHSSMNRQNEAASQEPNAREHRNRLQSLWRDYHWPLMLVLLLLVMLLGFAGFTKYATESGQAMSPFDRLYRTLQLAVLESGSVEGPVNWELEVARWLVPLVAAYTAVLAVATLFRTQLRMARLWFIRNHVVVCGLGEKGRLLAHSFRRQGYQVVAIELEADNPHVSSCRDQGTIVLVGDATDRALLRRAAVHRARHVIAVCGPDGANVEVATTTRELSAARKQGAVTCSVHLVSPQLCELLREQELATQAFTPFRLELFNVYERGARTLLRVHPPYRIDPGSAAEEPHLLVVGRGRLSESLVLYAARDWYADQRGTGRMLRISLVDQSAGDQVHELKKRYPALPTCCELVAHEMDVAGLEFQEGEFLFNAEGSNDLDMIYICLPEPALGLEAGLRLRRRLQQDEPRIVVRMVEGSGLARLLRHGDGTQGTLRNVHAFGLLERTCTPALVLDGTHEGLAQAVHEAYREERLRQASVERDGEPGREEPETDEALRPWESLPEALRESNRRQVDQIQAKLQAAGYGIKPLVDWEAMFHQFDPAEVELMARLEHERFVDERTGEGWVRGPKKDVGKKTNPDLRPWEELSPEAVSKNLNSVIQLPKVLSRGGFQVCRLEHKPVQARALGDSK